MSNAPASVAVAETSPTNTNGSNREALLAAAAEYVAGGLSLIPIDGNTKRPHGRYLPLVEGRPSWTPLQQRAASLSDVALWIAGGAQLAVAGGAVSGGLVIIDFDVARLYQAWAAAVDEHGGHLPVQRTGGGGYQVFFRLADFSAEPLKNDKLAWIADADNVTGRTVAIETRAEGGYAIIAPSRHPSGRLYAMLQGSLGAIPVLERWQGEYLLEAARELDEMPATKQVLEAQEREKQRREAEVEAQAGDYPNFRQNMNGQISVIDAFNAANAIESTLERYDYRRGYQRWIRPQGTSESVSIDRAGNRSFHHSTNDLLHGEYWHKPFDIFCQYEFGGDAKAAVKQAAQELGMKKPPRERAPRETYPDEMMESVQSFEAVQVELEKKAATRSAKPIIETNNRQLWEKRDDVIAAIQLYNSPPRLFHGGTGLAFISTDKDGLPEIKEAKRDVVVNVMTDAAEWISTAHVKKKDGEITEIVKQVMPPKDLADNYIAQPHWPGVPALDGIVTAPVVAPDGTICSERGYNPAARLWLEPPPGFDLSSAALQASMEPTAKNLAQAKEIILQTLLGEVAFTDDASRSHAVALMILPFVRRLIDGPTPLHLIDAPTQSSGKSYAAKICISPFAKPAASAMKGEEEEWRKAIVSALLAGRSHFFLDNVKGRLNSPTLAAALTEPALTERMMGGMSEVTVPIRCVWVATSNNAILDSDTASRCIVIRLDTGLENPEGRTYETDPLEYIQRNRTEVIAAILTLVRVWLKKKRPEYSGPQQSRFGNWQRVLGGILEAAEIPGFLGNLTAYRNTLDPEKAAWGVFVQAWYEAHGTKSVSAAELLPLVLEIPEMADTLGKSEGRGQTRSLGRQLQLRRDKVFGGHKILPGISTRNGATYKLLDLGGNDTEVLF